MTKPACKIEVLDLFSAAAGGWSLGMHRAGFKTIAACEFVDWRRALYQQNNPGVRIYDDVRTLTADQLVRDLGRLPSIIVGSPPCQDISSANTKGKGVEGERSGLYFEAVRIIGEVRPRWFALENSSNLRTRGADAVLAALEALGYACWPFVVRAGDIGANHERPRCWIVGCDLEQIANAGFAVPERRDALGGRSRRTEGAQRERLDGCDIRTVEASDPHGFRRDEGRGWRRSGLDLSVSEDPCGNSSNADEERQANGCVVSGIRPQEVANDGRGPRRGDEGSIAGQVGLCAADSSDSAGEPPSWSLDDLAAHIQLDDGLSAWVAGTRVAVGGPKGTSAASLIVEAFGDAVVPQIPEGIGRAILRTERALAIAYGRAAA